MAKSIWDLSEEAKDKHNTRKNTFSMFPVGTHVKIITPCQDFNFFYGETGKVKSNSGRYLGINVEFDQPRKFKDGSTQYDFGFQPDDLIVVSVPENLFELE